MANRPANSWIARFRNRHFLALDALLLCLVPLAALILRDDPRIWPQYIHVLHWYVGLALIIKLPIFFVFGLYKFYWRYASIDELLAIASAVAVASVVHGGVFALAWVGGLFEPNGFPRSVVLIDGLLMLLLVGGARFSLRAADHGWARRNPQHQKGVLIVGAGAAGSLIARELRNGRRSDLRPVGFIDDDDSKQGVWVGGVPVLGTRAQLASLISKHQVSEVIIAMPAAPGKLVRQVVAVCDAAKVTSRILPDFASVISGKASVSRLRHVQIEDLLRREPILVDLQSIAGMISGKRVLVTGAGGSIGSELCRQVARLRPAQLTLLGHGEFSLFQLSNELGQLFNGELNFQAVVADVRDRLRMTAVFDRVRPHLVFHAAAHKHVPMMEANLEDAITNNILGTRNVVELSNAFQVERFVLISSDKAVNPVSIMGATKRVAERVVGEVAKQSGRPYVAVRFGNVLGSRGSVVPLFRQQIAAGGPVTVTDPDVYRYFMTIPEAVQLVLQAAALSAQGEIYILDMGQPIRILDLAEDLIRLSGYQVGRDIDIVFTGLRPGEKLKEDLFLGSEAFSRTSHTHIFVVRNGYAPGSADADADLGQDINSLIAAAQQGRPDEVRRWLRLIVPEYAPTGPESARRAVYDGVEPAGKFSSAVEHIVQSS